MRFPQLEQQKDTVASSKSTVRSPRAVFGSFRRKPNFFVGSQALSMRRVLRPESRSDHRRANISLRRAPVAAATATMGKIVDDLKPLISAASSTSVRPSPISPRSSSAFVSSGWETTSVGIALTEGICSTRSIGLATSKPLRVAVARLALKTT